MAGYVRLTLERDVRELSRLRQGHLLRSVLERLAGQSAQLLNIDKAAREVCLDRATTDSYVTLLEKVYLLYRLPAWGRRLTARSGATPKVHLYDSGVAARLLKLSGARALSLDATARTEFGHVLESFVVGFEVKAGSRVAAGFVLYLGERDYTAGDRLHVVPVDRLWR